MKSIYEFLEEHNFTYQYFDHAPVFSAKDADHLPEMPGEEIKNLFLYDSKKKDYFLVVIPAHKRVNFKELCNSLNVKKLSFGSPQKLKDFLGVEPGSVTLLGLIYDIHHTIKIFFDEDLVGKSLQCHPLINTATLVIEFKTIEQFLTLTGHTYCSIKIIACQNFD